MAQNPTKVLQKEIKKAETAQKQQLKDAQKAEVKFLKAEGASKQEVNAEKKANTVEFKEAKTTLAPAGLQFIPQRRDDGFIVSNVGTYQDTYAPAIQPKIEQAISLLSDYSIPQSATRSTDNATITTGMSLNNAYALSAARESGQPITADLLKEQFGGYVSGANRQANIFNAVDRFNSDDVITASDFDKKLKPVKGQEGLFTSKIGGGTTGVFQYNPETDSYQYLSATPVKVTEEDGGFLGSLGGQLLVGLAGGLLLGPTASLLATGSTAGAATLGSTIAAGGLLGGLGSAITGGDILTGVITGGLGGGAMYGIGQAGGLGNVINRAGVNLSPRITNALNSLVSGVGAPSAQNAQLAADVLTANGIPTTADDILTSVAREAVEPGFPAGSNIMDVVPEGGGFRLTPNQVEGFIPSPSSLGVPAPVPGSTGGIGFNPNAGGIGFQVNPELFLPTPVGAGTMPAPSGVNVNIDRYMPIQPPSLLDNLTRQAGDIADEAYQYIRENPLQAAGIGATLIGAASGTPVQTGGAGRPPRLAEDIEFNPVAGTGQFSGIPTFPGMGGGLDYNAFMNLYRRGGLGAGQYLGYDLINRLGDIPAETLLGTPIFGGNIGQTSPSATSLV
jgi:hypothetical protein